MKEQYEKAKMEIIEFAAEDVITASITPGDNELPPIIPGT